MKGILIALLLPVSFVRAEEPALRDLLRDALYTEEVARDPEAAARQYRELLDRHEQDRPLAASALFRLAEVRRKQDRKDEAIQAYRQLLARYPEAEAETKLARENLAALGVEDIPPPGSIVEDEETKRLQELAGLERSSPDLMKDPGILNQAIGKGWLRVAALILDKNPDFDLNGSEILVDASSTGNLAMCRFLIGRGADPKSPSNQNALVDAVGSEYVQVASLLLDHGADPNAGAGEPLKHAVMTGNLEMARLLLKHGADPNLTNAEFHRTPGALNRTHYRQKGQQADFGVSIHLATTRPDVAMLKLLLDRGADPDLAEETTGLTALHLTSRSDWQGNPAAIPLLLEAGANPDPETKDIQNPRTGQQIIPAGSTPLRLAARNGLVEQARALIEGGASIRRPGLLPDIVRGGSVELLRLALEKGADPNLPDESPLRLAATLKGRKDMLKSLIDAGAEADETWIKDCFRDAAWENIPLLYRSFLVPHLLEKPAVTVVLPEIVPLLPSEMAARKADEAPPSLARLFLDHPGDWPCVTNSGHSLWPDRMTLWRKGADGGMEKISARIGDPDPLPELKWGDVIELAPDWDALGGKPESINYEYRKLPPEIIWSLRKRISFPVTVEIDGKEREITLRGDRLVFDPSTNEVPLIGARELMNLLWQSETGTMPRLLLNRAEILVQREDWPEIRLPLSSSGKDFPLAAGDRLKLSISGPSAETLLNIRKTRISVIGKDYPFSRHFGHPDLAGRLIPASVPTLIQALAETFHTHGLGSAPADSAALPPWLFGQNMTVISYPHRPDFSRIHIRRLQEDGSEKTIEVNLADIALASSDATTVEEARAADIPLQGGDIVELPVLPENPDQAWRGLSAREAAFFAKALDCRVQVTGGDGEITFAEISYHPPRFVETEAGLVPIPPESGTSSPTAAAIDDPERDVNVIRGEYPEAYLRATSIFLCDGDRLQFQGRPSQPIQQRNPRPGLPRPRVDPPKQ